MKEELDQLTTSLSAMLDRQRKDLDQGIRSMADALRQAADRVASYAPGAPRTTTAVAAAVVGTGAASASSGVLAVRVVNDAGSPIPVVMPGSARPAEDRGGGAAGWISGIAGGIGSLVGGVVGGLLSGGLGGAAMLAGAGIVLRQITVLAGTIDGFVERSLTFARTFVDTVRGLTNTLFDRLTQAGILPVSQLFASLLVFIDLGVAVVLAHLGTVINWADSLFGRLVDWFGAFVAALGDWAGQASARIGVFIEQLLAHALEHVVRPHVVVLTRDVTRTALEALTSVLLGFPVALAGVVVAALKHATSWATNHIAQSLYGPFGARHHPAPPPLDTTLDKAVTDGMAHGRQLSEFWLRKALGPPGAAPAPGTPGTAPLTPAKVPALKLPKLTAPDLTLPAPPSISPQLQKLLKGQPPTPDASPRPAGQAERGAALTLNGGVHIAVNAEHLDAEHADETARRLARSMLDELRRLTERERFRAGLPTTAGP
ncbi:hypothetical protein ACFVZZ_17740 [Streptomyces chartreusis]|uniref:hypothetical protein n=1 Tax=Streptomyces chartreusis TaxID=1969 RepID=UPI0036DE0DA9